MIPQSRSARATEAGSPRGSVLKPGYGGSLKARKVRARCSSTIYCSSFAQTRWEAPAAASVTHCRPHVAPILTRQFRLRCGKRLLDAVIPGGNPLSLTQCALLKGWRKHKRDPSNQFNYRH